VIGAISPVLRGRGRAAAGTLVAGAAIVLVFVTTSLIVQDPRAGLAAIEANRRFAMMIAGFEVPALSLALISLRRIDKLYWVGWGIHAALTVWLGVIFVWLEFFWHW
jgi:hypothetical protein